MDIQARQLRVGDLVDLQSDVCAVAFRDLYPELDEKWVQVNMLRFEGDNIAVSFLGAGTVIFPREHYVRVWKPLGGTVAASMDLRE